ncbi:organic cation transporter protein-like, partial [Homarus americanus]|uniref:organic cation transporter protein-like n=1 Tax=Homarus americanus TaxID=6706 RepID=UPI001C4620D0
WDLVCNRRALYSTTQAMVSVGNFLGYLLFGCLIEMIGRRRSVLLSGALSFVTGMVTALSPTLAFYMVMRILVAASCIGYYSGCLIICLEICSPKHRSIIGSLYAIPWAVGYMVLPGVAYLVRDWQMLQVALTIPSIFFVIYIWTLPESPRWLVIHGKKEEALKVLTKAASVNGKTLPPEQEMLAAMDRIKQKCLNMKEEPREELGLWRQVVARVQWFVAPIRLPHLRKIALPVFFCWFTCAMVYYGVSFSATNLRNDSENTAQETIIGQNRSSLKSSYIMDLSEQSFVSELSVVSNVVVFEQNLREEGRAFLDCTRVWRWRVLVGGLRSRL